MRRMGVGLLLIGFLGGAFAAVRNVDMPEAPWAAVSWGGYALGMAVGICGVAVLRLTGRQAASRAGQGEADLVTLDETLGRLVARLGVLNRERETTGVFDVYGLIDDGLAEDLGVFADARESLIPRYGLQGYADVMSRFATAERLINRAWSASVDGYIDEVWACIQRAYAVMIDAHTLLGRLREEGN